ncbi:MAG: hypothetical protein AAB787_01390 [Patescibacteria group bacterium]
MQGLPIAVLMAASLPAGAAFHLENHGDDVIRMVGIDASETESRGEDTFLVRNERTGNPFFIEGTRPVFPTQ